MQSGCKSLDISALVEVVLVCQGADDRVAILRSSEFAGVLLYEIKQFRGNQVGRSAERGLELKLVFLANQAVALNQVLDRFEQVCTSFALRFKNIKELAGQLVPQFAVSEQARREFVKLLDACLQTEQRIGSIGCSVQLGELRAPTFERP